MGSLESKIASATTMLHYGEYEQWNRSSKKLPSLKHICTDIPVSLNAEFGYTLLIKGLKGKTISFTIQHPPFKDEHGEISPDFTGEVCINSNAFTFYLGDCIWEPIEDKIGLWRLITHIENICLADKTLNIYQETQDEDYDLDW